MLHYRKALVATLLGISIVALFLPSVSRAADDSDIPGVSWPGGIVRSSVGGALYDRVWSLDLPEGRVALIRLSGEPGAELGLYLFGHDATSVLSSTPLRQSAVAGANQRITAVLPAGSYFVNVNGRNKNKAYNFSLSIALLKDPTPPVVIAEIEGGRARISTTTPQITVDAEDTLSGVTAIRVRRDGAEWGAWLDPETQPSVTLPAIEGLYRIEAQARNGADLVSAPVSDEVYLDLKAPSATRLSPDENSVVVTPTPTITYRFDEAMDSRLWSTSGLTLLSMSGEVIGGRGTYRAATRTGTFTTAPLTPGTEYIVQLGDAVDLAGNRATESAWTITYLQATALQVSKRIVRVTGNTTVEIPFRALGVPAGAQIVLERLDAVGGNVARWTPVGSVTANGTGTTQRMRFQPTQGGRYALRFPGSVTHATSRTSSVRVILTPTLNLLGGNGIRELAAGAVAEADFLVAPTGLAAVELVRYQCTAAFTKCTVIEQSEVEPGLDGRIEVRELLPNGNWAWRIRVPQSTEYELTSSLLARFQVR
jgi:hypothetical protein